MDIITKTKSDAPPCDAGCAMRSHCKVNNDTCAQYTTWERTEKIDLEACRTPKQRKTKKDNRRKRVYHHVHQDPVLIARQMKIKHWLGEMKPKQISAVARLLCMTPEALIEHRCPARGLTKVFMGRMHKASVFNYLQEQGIAQKVAA